MTKGEVKMTGYWPSFFCVFIDLDEVEVNKNAETNEANIQPYTREIPSWQHGPMMLARVANRNTEFALSGPLADSAT